MTQESNTLVLEIFRQDKALKMSVFEQREFASTLRHFSQCQISLTEINRLCEEVISILNKTGQRCIYAQDLIKGLIKTGQLLWDHLLTRQVKDKLRSSQILDLVLSIDEELINIPWELLHDGRNFLCLNFNLGRVVRTKEQLTLAQYRSYSLAPKMLILANPTNDLKSAYLEGLSIKNQLDRKRKEISVNFKSTEIELFYLKKNLRDYDIVHFAGHGEYDSANHNNTGWVLSDGRFTAGDILTLAQTAPLPSLVFSNACHSAAESLDLIDASYQQKNYSFAAAFLFSGVRHYVGAIRKIEDPVSLDFAREFYTQLIAGRSVGESMRQSRLKLVKEYGIANIHWASYLLYGDPNFVLFRAKLRHRPKRFKNIASFFKRRIVWLFLAATILSIYLYIRIPAINPNTYYLFLKSRKMFQEGNNQEVILLSNRIIKKNPYFLSVYPLLGAVYQRMGERESALKYYYDYALFSEKRQDKKNLTSAYIKLGWFYHLGGEYPKAFDFYQKAITLAKETRDKLNEAIALRKLAVWYIDKKDYFNALELLTKSSEINRQRQAIYEHRYNLACDYFDIGLVFTNKDDFTAAKEFYAKSRAYFEKLKLKDELSDYYFNLGEICLFEKEYQKALDYYMAGLRIDERNNNKMNLASDFNMIGELYVEMDDSSKAEDFFKRAVLISQQINARQELADACSNLGLLYKKLRKANKAREFLRQAQEIYRQIDLDSYEEIKKELLGLNGS